MPYHGLSFGQFQAERLAESSRNRSGIFGNFFAEGIYAFPRLDFRTISGRSYSGMVAETLNNPSMPYQGWSFRRFQEERLAES